MSKENYETNMETVKKCQEIAKRLDVSTSQLALAWLMCKGDDICIIPGTTKISNLASNMSACEVAAKLTPEDVKLIDDMKPFDGLRYQHNNMTWNSLK